MYIIVVLDVPTNEVSIFNIENELLSAQDNFLDKISELSHPDNPAAVRESVFLAKDKVNIYEKYHGWVSSSKQLVKIVTLHHIKEYHIVDADEEILS